MHRRCTGSLPREERELRDSALYIIQNLQMLTLALRLCDFKDVAVAVESKHVRMPCLISSLPAFLNVSVAP